LIENSTDTIPGSLADGKVLRTSDEGRRCPPQEAAPQKVIRALILIITNGYENPEQECGRRDAGRDSDKACTKRIDALGDVGADLAGGIDGESLDPESGVARPERRLPCPGAVPEGN
jgi:hypothetical protein